MRTGAMGRPRCAFGVLMRLCLLQWGRSPIKDASARERQCQVLGASNSCPAPAACHCAEWGPRPSSAHGPGRAPESGSHSTGAAGPDGSLRWNARPTDPRHPGDGRGTTTNAGPTTLSRTPRGEPRAVMSSWRRWDQTLPLTRPPRHTDLLSRRRGHRDATE